MKAQERLIKDLISCAIAVVISQIVYDEIHKVLIDDLEWYDHYLQKTAFKLNWK
jgi:hypothetical protein